MGRRRRWWFGGTATVIVVVAVAAAIAGRGNASVGPIRLLTVTFPRDCVLQMRLPVSLRLTVEPSNPRVFRVAGAGLPRDATGVCLSRGSLAAVASAGASSHRQMFRNGPFRGQIISDAEGVTYVVMLAHGILAIVHRGRENLAVVYLIEHVRGRSL
jgi:hypothetical protein